MTKKAAPKKKTTPAEEPALTEKQAAEMVLAWTADWLNTDEQIGDFLLQLRTLGDERDLDTRQSMLLNIETTVMPFSVAACDAINALLASRAKVATDDGEERSAT